MMRVFFKQHYLAFLLAILVGLIYITPNIFFILSLGRDYQGIPMMQTANEISYLARIREILDGHPALGSFALFEYKDQWPIAPPTSEMVYAIPSIVFRTSPQNIIIASRFFLPFVLFLLIYFLICKLTIDTDLSSKINAIAGALLVTLGYDLVDYGSVLGFLRGEQALAGNFLIWARPVNPIVGAIFLFSFLLFVCAVIQGTHWLKLATIGASLFLAFAIGSYFFSWGIAVSVLGALILIFLFKKDHRMAAKLAVIFPAAFFFSIPYWLIVWKTSQSPWYEDSVLRSGLFYTRYPLLNKFVVITLIIYVLVVGFAYIKAKKERILYLFEPWHLFSLALIIGSFWAYSQQIITGKTVWPYHFVQYSIPLMMTVLTILFFNILRKMSIWLWRSGIVVLISASLLFGVYTQASVYSRSHEYYRNLQPYASLFGWLNNKEKDCVVLVRENESESSMLNVMIPAFTHCNRYVSTEIAALMPNDRALHNYLVSLRLNGVETNAVKEYLRENRNKAKSYLFSNWRGIYDYSAKDFPDFSDVLLEQRLKGFPEAYRQFAARDFKTELTKYRLDYILSVNALPENIISQLNGLKLIFNSNKVFLYNFSNVKNGT